MTSELGHLTSSSTISFIYVLLTDQVHEHHQLMPVHPADNSTDYERSTE